MSRVARIGLLLVELGAVVGVVYTFIVFRTQRGLVAGEDVEISLCRADYARARTATDTSIIDLRTPIVRREQATVARSCGDLRRVGLLAEKPR